MNFLAALLSSDESRIDSIILAALLCILTLCGVCVYLAIVTPASWSPVGFAGAAATIIGAGAAGKTARDRLTPQPAPSQPEPTQ